jgi:hypothetical protein
MILARQYGSSNGDSYILWLDGNEACFIGGARVYGQALDDHTWYHLAGVKRGPTIELYVNGKLQEQSNSARVPVYNDDNEVTIGAGDNGDMSEHFDGKIDEARASGVARSRSWIRLCYENQKIGSNLVRLQR